MEKDNLLQLLKALSTQEKKAFSSQMNTEHKAKIPYFLELYKQYTKQINKDLTDSEIENTIKQFLKRKPKLFNDIANIRNQLKQKVFLSVISNQVFDKPKSKIRYQINVIEFLLKRKLFDEAQLTINQVKKLAALNNNNKSLIEITDLHLFLVGQQSGKKDLELQSKLVEELNLYHSLYGLELTLKNIYRQLTLIAQNDLKLKKEESKKAFHKVYQQFDFDSFPITAYKTNKHTLIVFWYYTAKNLYNRSIDNFEEAFRGNKKLIKYFESDPTLVLEFESAYVKSLCGFTMVCQDSKNFKEMEKGLQKVKVMYEKKKNHTALEATCDIGVLYYLNTHQYQKAEELSNFIEKEWKTISAKTFDGKLLWYCHSSLLLFWVIANKTQFKYWLEKGLNIPRSNKGKVYYFGIRMFEIINDFEQNNWHTFLHKVEALQKTLINNGKLSSFEKIVLAYFKKLYNIRNGNKNINLNKSEKEALESKVLQQLKEALKALNLKNSPINYYEMILWCDSHLQNKSIKEVFEAG